MEAIGTRVPTAEEAKVAREQIRAFRSAERAAKAARAERRAERAEEMGRWEHAWAKAQAEIVGGKNVLKNLDEAIAEKRAIISTAHEELAALLLKRGDYAGILNKCYAERASARDALRKLHAEIRGVQE